MSYVESWCIKELGAYDCCGVNRLGFWNGCVWSRWVWKPCMSIAAAVSLWLAEFGTERGVPSWNPIPGVCKSPA